MAKRRRTAPKSKNEHDSAPQDTLNDEDWITKLARITAAGPATSKEDRIEKRAAKRRRRQERQQQQQQQPQRKVGTNRVGVEVDHFVNKERLQQRQEKSKTRERHRMTKQLLLDLATRIDEVSTALESSRQRVGWDRPRSCNESPSSSQRQFKKRKWEVSYLQPRRRDYGGIGLARPSAFLPFDDPSFTAKLEESFAEHVPGFFGKARTKVMKKQVDHKKMIWKKLGDVKKSNQKIHGKKLSDMSPDERVEAMIKAGMI